MQSWNEMVDQPPPGDPTKQNNWSSVLYKKTRDDLFASMDAHGRGRLYGCESWGSGDWVSCLPSASLGLHLNQDQLRIATCLRIGAPVSLPHICVCGEVADSQGKHALSCKRSSSRHSRHSEVNQIIARALKSGGVPSRLEPTGLSRTDGKRPDGITLTPWRRGLSLLWDATIVSRVIRWPRR